MYVVPPSALADQLLRTRGASKCIAIIVWDKTAVPKLLPPLQPLRPPTELPRPERSASSILSPTPPQPPPAKSALTPTPTTAGALERPSSAIRTTVFSEGLLSRRLPGVKTQRFEGRLRLLSGQFDTAVCPPACAPLGSINISAVRDYLYKVFATLESKVAVVEVEPENEADIKPYVETERVLREHRRALVMLDSPQCLLYLLPCCDLANELCPNEEVTEDGRLLAVTFHSKGVAVSDAERGDPAAAPFGNDRHSTPHPLLSPVPLAGAVPSHLGHLGPTVRPLWFHRGSSSYAGIAHRRGDMPRVPYEVCWGYSRVLTGALTGVLQGGNLIGPTELAMSSAYWQH
jgi:hypothetical protein